MALASSALWGIHGRLHRRPYTEDMSSSPVTTEVSRLLFPLGQRRAIVKTLSLAGDVRHDCLPKGYIRNDSYYLTASRWKGITLRPLLFGLAVATANGH